MMNLKTRESSELKPIESAIDPFVTLSDHLDERLQKAKQDYAAWKNMVEVSQTASEKFRQFDGNLRDEVKSIRADTVQLGKALKQVRKNRTDFAFIDEREFAMRTKFVEQTKHAADEILKDLNSASTTAKIRKDQRAEILTRPATVQVVVDIPEEKGTHGDRIASKYAKCKHSATGRNS
jgi:DNA repair exonuclease SbcCD ATPase subunit